MDAQRSAVEQHAKSVGGEVAAEFRDVESGRKADRSGLAAALAECRVRRATLLIAKLDRLARSVAFISNLMEGRVDFVVADMPGIDRLTVHVLAAFAEHEREMISRRTKAALAAAKARGIRLGNPRLPPAGQLAAAPAPVTPGGVARCQTTSGTHPACCLKTECYRASRCRRSHSAQCRSALPPSTRSQLSRTTAQAALPAPLPPAAPS